MTCEREEATPMNPDTPSSALDRGGFVRNENEIAASFNRRRGQAGASLIMVIVVMVLVGVTLTALVGYANTSQNVSPVYGNIRELRYSGDSAIKQAVNWAKDNPSVAVDPDYLPAAATNCVFKAQTESGVTVKVDCAAEAGSGSGRPAEGGMIPTEALVLTGDRHNEAGPYNAAPCAGIGDVIWNALDGWFNGSAKSTSGIRNKEFSLLVRKNPVDYVFSCSDRPRDMEKLIVEGKIRAAGRIQNDGGQLINKDGTPADLRARYGCNFTCSSTMDVRPAGAGSAAGTPTDSDPGINQSTLTAEEKKNPFLKIGPEWRAVGFKQDGTPIDPAAIPARDGVGAPGRALVWNPTTQKLEATPNASCVGLNAARTLIFLPGWYRSAATFNQYTTSPSCAGYTMWLAPAGKFAADGSVLEGAGVTAPFYLDFRDNNGTITGVQCNGSPAHPNRWCIGGVLHNTASRSKVRVVVGTPKNWNPIGTGTVGSGTSQSTVAVSLDTASTVVQTFLAEGWSNTNGAKKFGDNNYADYAPPFCFIWCYSSDRMIAISGFSPRVSAGAYDGKVNLQVGVGGHNESSRPFVGELEIAAITSESGPRDCGRFPITIPTYTGTGPIPVVNLLDPVNTTGATLGSRCGTDDLINGLEVKLKVTGNPLNYGPPSPPRVWFDGVKISYSSVTGASFAGAQFTPKPTEAPSDCDPTEAGAQLIFGGDSNVYVADGSLEICAGDYPTQASQHMNIGVYGVPAVPPIRPAAVTKDDGTPEVSVSWLGVCTSIPATFLESNTARRIGEPEGIRVIPAPGFDPPHDPTRDAIFRYGNQCLSGFNGPYDGGGWGFRVSFFRTNLTFPTYSPPTGWSIKKIEARVSYNSRNPSDALNWAIGNHSRLETPSGHQIDVPYTSATVGWANAQKLTLYGPGAAVANAITPAQLASGTTLKWWARGYCPASSCPHTGDTLDGIELLVTLEPTNDAGGPRLTPQSGCIIAFPNYGDGEGQPDCAIVKADQRLAGDLDPGSPTIGWFYSGEGDWYGRLSVKGTVYAPSSALDIDDTDVAYALATRGAVLRHLRLKGFGYRDPYNKPAIGTSADNGPTPRAAVFTACTQSAARLANSSAKCDTAQGDQIITRAGVRFAVRADKTAADVPLIQWWTTGDEMDSPG